MGRLDEKLARLDARLQAQEAVRAARIKVIMAQAEDQARRAAAGGRPRRAFSPRGCAPSPNGRWPRPRPARAPRDAAERAIQAIQPQLDALSRRLDTLGAEDAEGSK